VRWELGNGRCLLAEHGGRTFALTHDGNLTVMDNATGERVLAFYVPNRPLAASNTEDALVLLGSHDGQVVALKPRGSAVALARSGRSGQEAISQPGTGAEAGLVVNFGQGVGPIHYGMTGSEVREALGEPDEGSDQRRFLYQQRGLVVGFDADGQVESFQCGGLADSPEAARAMPWQCRTSEGVALWDPASRVIEIYGPASYPDERTMAYSERGAYFRLHEGRVMSIVLQRPE
jgi:hypothetical protein